MNHPSREEWMSYLYGELNAGERAKLAEHAASCAECAALFREWHAARKQLDAWQVRAGGALSFARKNRSVFAGAALKWAAAAVVLLGLGFGIGRLTTAKADAERVRTEIEPAIREQLRQEFAQMLRDELNRKAADTLAAANGETRKLLANYSSQAEAKRVQDYQAISSALDKLDAQRVADYVSLKKQLDTVAVLTDASFRQTDQQLAQLASYVPPAGLSNSPSE